MQNLEHARKEKGDLEKKLKASGYDEAQEAELSARREEEISQFEQVKRVSRLSLFFLNLRS